MGSLIFFVFSFSCLPSVSIQMGVLLMLATLLSVYKGLNFSWWFGLLFFLIYVGAVLVLIYYMFSLSSNSNNFVGSYYYFFFLGLLIFFSMFDFNVDYLEESQAYYNKKENLLSFEDGLIVVFSMMLLMALWMSNKLQIYKKLALRVFF